MEKYLYKIKKRKVQRRTISSLIEYRNKKDKFSGAPQTIFPQNLIPNLDQYPLVGVKTLSWLDWMKFNLSCHLGSEWG
jgi:hypothetical protein